jgi:LysM repeat protein
MLKKNNSRISILLISIALAFIASGFSRQIGALNFSADDVINAVNNLRTAGGLPALQVNSALMAAAQSHSEYQAAVHQSSHSSVSGAIAANGYGSGGEFLAGENVAALTLGTENSVSIIVSEIWADSVHRGAMMNPKYTDIGVGVACDEEMVYITLNVAGLKAGTAKASTPQNPETPSAPLPPILARVTSTPMSDGTVYHLVGYGQTLGTIAGMYGVSIQQIVDANGIDPNKIYAGQRLYIKKALLPTSTSTVEPSLSPAPSNTIKPATPTSTETASPTATVTPVPVTPMEINTRELGIGLIFVLMVVFLLILLISRNNASKSVQS